MDYQSQNHTKFLILYHLIFVCKDRKKLLISYGNEVKQVFEESAAAPLEMQAKKPSASISNVKGEARRSSTRLKTSWFSRRA